jgi:hypothetical protein
MDFDVGNTESIVEITGKRNRYVTGKFELTPKIIIYSRRG